jgi:hypothetical protein
VERLKEKRAFFFTPRVDKKEEIAELFIISFTYGQQSE